MTPAPVTLENHTPGDTWQGIAAIGPVRCGPTGTDPMPVAAASARLWFTKVGASTPSLKLASSAAADYADADAPITLVSGANWQFVIPPVAPDVWLPTPGKYRGHFEVTDANGDPLTIYDITLNVGIDLTP